MHAHSKLWIRRMVQGRMERVIFTYQNPVLKLIDRISLLCHREGYCLDATLRYSQRQHPQRISWDRKQLATSLQPRPAKLLHLTGDKNCDALPNILGGTGVSLHSPKVDETQCSSKFPRYFDGCRPRECHGESCSFHRQLQNSFAALPRQALRFRIATVSAKLWLEEWAIVNMNVAC